MQRNPRQRSRMDFLCHVSSGLGDLPRHVTGTVQLVWRHGDYMNSMEFTGYAGPLSIDRIAVNKVSFTPSQPLLRILGFNRSTRHVDHTPGLSLELTFAEDESVGFSLWLPQLLNAMVRGEPVPPAPHPVDQLRGSTNFWSAAAWEDYSLWKKHDDEQKRIERLRREDALEAARRALPRTT